MSTNSESTNLLEPFDDADFFSPSEPPKPRKRLRRSDFYVTTETQEKKEEQSEESSQGSNSDGNSSEQETSENGKRKRSKNLTWQETFALVDQVWHHGKNFSLIFNNLQNNSHLFTNVTSFQTLASHFNNLNKKTSRINKDLKIPVFKLTPSLRSQGKAAIAKAQLEHTQHWKSIEEKKEIAKQQLKQIEKREIKASSDKRASSTDVRKDMDEKADERREARKKRLERFKCEEKLDRIYKKRVADFLKIEKERAEEDRETLRDLAKTQKRFAIAFEKFVDKTN